jgi:hypothetical protein
MELWQYLAEQFPAISLLLQGVEGEDIQMMEDTEREQVAEQVDIKHLLKLLAHITLL